MGTGKRILVAPLDWGLGHATRCVPLIRKKLREGHTVLLASNGFSRNFLRGQFPELKILESSGYNIQYPVYLPMSLSLFFQSPKILYRIFREHRWLKKVIREEKINEVISDNRYGLWNKSVHCTFITHQLMIKCPKGLKFLEPLLHALVKWFIGKYDRCLVPDLSGTENLSGDLSHLYPLPGNAAFCGWLSRFDEIKIPPAAAHTYDFCFLLSGPEPQRTLLEIKIRKLSAGLRGKAILIQGKPEIKIRDVQEGNLRIVSHLDDETLASTLRQSGLIVCRSGYSTLMDLKVLGCSALLIPTPGQTEQEYLAGHLNGKEGFRRIVQEELSLEVLEESLLPFRKVHASVSLLPD